MKFKIPTWDQGKAFMKELALTVGGDIIEVDADLRIDQENFSAHCHFDDRGITAILLKFSDLLLEPSLKELKDKYPI